MAIHNSATVGFSNANLYDAHRPSYPPGAVKKLLDHLSLSNVQGAKIIDLAAGTGKLTEVLAGRPEGYEILAVEPHEKMRKTLDDKALKGTRTADGTAQDMSNVEDGWADVVVVAQAFHWFAKEDAVREIHRVLKPGGKLAVIWNIENYNKPRAWTAKTAWEQSLHELVINAATDGQPRFRDYVWRDIFSAPAVQQLFSTPLEEDKTEWTVLLTPELLWDRVRTLSHVSMLVDQGDTEFKRRFDEIVEEGDGEWDELGQVIVHGRTPFAWTTKL